jgi:hypothetical protein
MHRDQAPISAAINRLSGELQTKIVHRRSQGELTRLMKQQSDGEPSAQTRSVAILIARLGECLEDGTWRLMGSNDIPICVRRAEGCLLEPSQGDLVQVLVDGTVGWIVTVLERTDRHAAAKIDFGERDLVVHTGSLDIQASRSIRSRAEAISSVAEVIREISNEKSSLIREASFTQCRSMSVNADQHIRMHSSLATIAADALLKLDGTQIHMG